jgi:hypothetical protein
MFPPTSGREMIPELEPSAEAEDDFQDYGRPAASRYSVRFRILAFGIAVGGFIAVFYALTIAMLRLIAGPDYADPLMERWELSRPFGQRFLSVFLSELLRAAPFMILVATLAAAAQFLIRRTHQEARLTRDLVRGLAARSGRPSRPVPSAEEKTGAEIVRPLRRELNLELDAPPDQP